MKITKKQLRRIIHESLHEGTFSDMDIEAMEQGTGRYADPGTSAPGYENPAKGWHRLSKTEFTWLTDAVESLQRRVNELEDNVTMPRTK